MVKDHNSDSHNFFFCLLFDRSALLSVKVRVLQLIGVCQYLISGLFAL